MKGLEALNCIKEFNSSKDWDKFFYKKISNSIFNRAEYIISHLNIEPDVSPITDGYIQLEYEYNNCYLEIVIVEKNRLEIFVIIENREYEFIFPKLHFDTRVDDVKFLNVYVDMFFNEIDRFEYLTANYSEVQTP